MVDAAVTRMDLYEEILGRERFERLTRRNIGHIYWYAVRNLGGRDINLVRAIAAGNITVAKIEADHELWRAAQKGARTSEVLAG